MESLRLVKSSRTVKTNPDGNMKTHWWWYLNPACYLAPSQLGHGKNQKLLNSGAGLGSQEGRIRLRCGALPLIPDSGQNRSSLRLSLHPLSTNWQHSNLICLVMFLIPCFFRNNSKTCDFMTRKSKMLTGCSCYYRHISGSVCVIK